VTPPTARVLGELSPPHVTARDIAHAVRALRLHSPASATPGAPCRRDWAAHPCLLYRWGQRVLAAHGLTEPQIALLAAGADLDGGAR
jgi:hypothetical protein